MGTQWRRELARTHKTIPDSITIAAGTWLRAEYRRAHTNEKYDGLNRNCCQCDGNYLRLIDKACSVTIRLPDQFDQVAKRLPDQFDQVAKRLPDHFDQVAKWLPDQFDQVAKRLPDQFEQVAKTVLPYFIKLIK